MISWRVPRWIDRRIETFVTNYNQNEMGDKTPLTKTALLTELVLIGLAAYPMPPAVDESL